MLLKMLLEINLLLMTDVVHVNYRSAGPLSLLIMDIPWLLIAIMRLATTKVEGNAIFGDLPILPEKGFSNVKRQ